eukprot:gene949-399_t
MSRASPVPQAAADPDLTSVDPSPHPGLLEPCDPHVWPNLAKELHVYESKTPPARFYLVGSDPTRTVYKLLRVERTNLHQLDIIEDPTDFSRTQVTDLLKTIQEVKGGLVKRIKCKGLLGFIRFSHCYYMVLITERTKVGMIGAHSIYEIAGTEMLPLADSTRGTGLGSLTKDDEARYRDMFCRLDLTQGFYFSYSYDLTRSLQTNILSWQAAEAPLSLQMPPAVAVRSSSPPVPMWSVDDMFAWNSHMMTEFAAATSGATWRWVVPIIHGYYRQVSVNCLGRLVRLSVVARRSRYFAGTRYLKRGVNEDGNVANHTENEQIVEEPGQSSRLRCCGCFSSVVQIRGSVPLFWTQTVEKMIKVKPVVKMNRFDPNCDAVKRHFAQLFNAHGTPIVCLDLLKQKEKVLRELPLSQAYRSAVESLNQSMPSEHRLVYIPWDYRHATKSAAAEKVINDVTAIAEMTCQRTGVFAVNCGSGAMALQSGALRTNCLDCLDRTNLAQFFHAKHCLGVQLAEMGFIQGPSDLTACGDLFTMLLKVYIELGDNIALQYGGSRTVSSGILHRGVAWDLVTNVQRAYVNSFMDQERQNAMNLFLGYYTPVHLFQPITPPRTLLQPWYARRCSERCQWIPAEYLPSSPLIKFSESDGAELIQTKQDQQAQAKHMCASHPQPVLEDLAVSSCDYGSSAITVEISGQPHVVDLSQMLFFHVDKPDVSYPVRQHSSSQTSSYPAAVTSTDSLSSLGSHAGQQISSTSDLRSPPQSTQGSTTVAGDGPDTRSAAITPAAPIPVSNRVSRMKAWWSGGASGSAPDKATQAQAYGRLTCCSVHPHDDCPAILATHQVTPSGHVVPVNTALREKDRRTKVSACSSTDVHLDSRTAVSPLTEGLISECAMPLWDIDSDYYLQLLACNHTRLPLPTPWWQSARTHQQYQDTALTCLDSASDTCAADEPQRAEGPSLLRQQVHDMSADLFIAEHYQSGRVSKLGPHRASVAPAQAGTDHQLNGEVLDPSEWSVSINSGVRDQMSEIDWTSETHMQEHTWVLKPLMSSAWKAWVQQSRGTQYYNEMVKSLADAGKAGGDSDVFAGFCAAQNCPGQSAKIDSLHTYQEYESLVATYHTGTNTNPAEDVTYRCHGTSGLLTHRLLEGTHLNTLSKKRVQSESPLHQEYQQYVDSFTDYEAHHSAASDPAPKSSRQGSPGLGQPTDVRSYQSTDSVSMPTDHLASFFIDGSTRGKVHARVLHIIRDLTAAVEAGEFPCRRNRIRHVAIKGMSAQPGPQQTSQQQAKGVVELPEMLRGDVYPNSFLGCEAVDWLMLRASGYGLKGMTPPYLACNSSGSPAQQLTLHGFSLTSESTPHRTRATDFLHFLLEANVLHHVVMVHPFRDGLFLYRLMSHTQRNVLNMFEVPQCGGPGALPSLPPLELSAYLLRNAVRLYNDFKDSDMIIDSFLSSPSFKQFCHLTTTLQPVLQPSEISMPQGVQPHLLPHQDRMAFYINVSGNWFRSQIKNGVLRGNNPPPSHILAPFSHDDRACLCFSKIDPRLHFCLLDLYMDSDNVHLSNMTKHPAESPAPERRKSVVRWTSVNNRGSYQPGQRAENHIGSDISSALHTNLAPHTPLPPVSPPVLVSLGSPDFDGDSPTPDRTPRTPKRRHHASMKGSAE